MTIGVPVPGPGTTTLVRSNTVLTRAASTISDGGRWLRHVDRAGASAFVAAFAKEFGYTPGLAQERRRGLRV